MRRISVLFALLAVCAPCVRGQRVSIRSSPSRSQGHAPWVAITTRCEPEKPVVGEQCKIFVELDVDRRAVPERISVDIDWDEGSVVYGSKDLERLVPRASTRRGFVVLPYRLPVRFLKPISRTCAMRVKFHDVYGGVFHLEEKALALDVRPLPALGRPVDFSGAVGRRFEMKQTLDRDHVRPNDLITATYTLDFDGYCPSNICPSVEHLSKQFKVYPPKEVERTGHRVVWKQDLVPQTAQVTNTARVSFSYYDSRKECYETARAEPLKLTFVSTEAASTVNTSVVVTGSVEAQPSPAGDDAQSASRPVILHFAPSDASPVIAKLPPGTPVKELATWNGWHRLETPRAIGWSKSH